MDKSSSLPPNKDQKKYDQDDDSIDWGKRGFKEGEGQGGDERSEDPVEEKSGNKGYDEDQPGHPVRSTGSLRKDQESGSVQPGDFRKGKK